MKEDAANSFNKAATKPISVAMLDKWKKQLAPEDVAMIEAVCRADMKAFGYSFSGSRLTLQQRMELLVKNGYWKLQEWRHRRVRHFTVKSMMFARLRRRLAAKASSTFKVQRSGLGNNNEG